MIIRASLSVIVWIALPWVSTGAWPQQAAGTAEIHITSGQLTLRADHLSAQEALARIARALNARLFVSGTLDTRVGPWHLQQVPVVEALAQIVRPASMLVVHERDPEGSANLLVREIHVVADGSTGQTQSVRVAISADQWVIDLARQLHSDAAPQVRRTAAAALGHHQTVDSVRALERALSDRDGGVRMAVIEALGRIGTDDAIRLVGQSAMGTADAQARAAAIQVLEASTSQYASALLQAIRSQVSGEVRAPGARRESGQRE